ncbi:MAG TPA: hypothetical protein VH879_02075 [Gemmatimonadales bacterium]
MGDRLYIDLNPGNADHNVGLLARFSATGLVGQWEWVTFTGPRTRGLFSASRD